MHAANLTRRERDIFPCSHGATRPPTSRAHFPSATKSRRPTRSTSGAREEVWVYGLRNPWRFSFADDAAAQVADFMMPTIEYGPTESALPAETDFTTSSFGEDDKGKPYVIRFEGAVYRLSVE